MPTVKILLDDREREALVVLSRRERRDPRAQAAVILRQELERRGLLPIPDAHAQGHAAQEVATQ